MKKVILNFKKVIFNDFLHDESNIVLGLFFYIEK